MSCGYGERGEGNLAGSFIPTLKQGSSAPKPSPVIRIAANPSASVADLFRSPRCDFVGSEGTREVAR
jgi:hypothetical protein